MLSMIQKLEKKTYVWDDHEACDVGASSAEPPAMPGAVVSLIRPDALAQKSSPALGSVTQQLNPIDSSVIDKVFPLYIPSAVAHPWRATGAILAALLQDTLVLHPCTNSSIVGWA